MPKILRVVDTENWKEYVKAKWVASEFKMPYQNFTEKLSGSRFNDTRFVYGELFPMNLEREFKSQKNDIFKFRFKFYERNKMSWYYIVEINNELIKISKENGDLYLNKDVEI